MQNYFVVYQESNTRWNSRLTSLRSVITQLDDIASLLARSDRAELMEDLDADLLADVVKFLEPFEEATKDLESDQTPTLHKAVLWFCKLKLLASLTGSETRNCMNA
jgi:hypothetical protein